MIDPKDGPGPQFDEHLKKSFGLCVGGADEELPRQLSFAGSNVDLITPKDEVLNRV